MSCIERDMIEGYQDIARMIQAFMWEGIPFKSNKKIHTVEELEVFLEDIRESCWNTYNDGAKYMGWRE